MANTKTIRDTTITVGTSIDPYQARPSAIQLFRFSAATWNAHRIHYDTEYARIEGYPDILVQSHLHGCYLTNAVLRWAGRAARLRAFRWSNRHITVAGDTLTVTGTVTAVVTEDNVQVVEVDLEEHNERGDLCVSGHAVVEIPLSAVSDG